MLVFLGLFVFLLQGSESHIQHEGKSFLNKDAALTFFRSKRHVCGAYGSDCTGEGYCEANKDACTREEDREYYCTATTCSPGLTCYLSVPCPCHYTTGCINDQCKTIPCRNGGTCTLTTTSYTCACPVAYTGATCESEVNECDSSPCQNGGHCSDHVGYYTCSCQAGFTGSNCETEINECDSSPCQNSGHCSDQIGYYTCSCQAGYTGTNCETEINECDSSPCQNGGHCSDKIGHYTCSCQPGYIGTSCETDINECDSSPCQHGGHCSDQINHYTCNCQPGYIGNSCETEINECDSSPCQNFAHCSDHINYYTCSCQVGYLGTNCETEINECDSSPCQNGGHCSDHIGYYTCSCLAGYVGTNCQTEINECDSSPCQNLGHCSDHINYYTCICQAGYLGSNCETEINECDSSPCQNGASCSDNIDSYTCTCQAGYHGTNCETEINECDSSPCQNDGHCSDHIGFYTCGCQPGYIGTDCETDVNECASTPCLNQGSCSDLPNQFACTCTDRYNGTVCEKDCRPGPGDILFVIDVSKSSIAVMNKIFDFIDIFIDRLPIGPDDYQIAAITYSKNVTLEFDFDDNHDNVSLSLAIRSIQSTNFSTYTNRALDEARDILLDQSTGWRQISAKYVIIIYDGLSTKRNDVFISRQKLLYAVPGISLFTVGVGEQVDKTELIDVASSPEYVFSTTNNDVLNRIQRDTVHADCTDCEEKTTTDIVMVFDASENQGITEFQSLLDIGQEFIGIIDSKLHEDVRLSVISCAETVRSYMSFVEDPQKVNIKSRIQTINREHKHSNLTNALEYARLEAFQNSRGGRHNARKMIMIFSNAKWNSHSEAKDEATKLKASGITVINIGVGLDTDIDRLLDIASDPYYVYIILDHLTDQLKVIAAETSYTTCNDDIFKIRI